MFFSDLSLGLSCLKENNSDSPRPDFIVFPTQNIQDPDLQNTRTEQYHRKKIHVPGTGLGPPATLGRGFLPSSLQKKVQEVKKTEKPRT